MCFLPSLFPITLAVGLVACVKVPARNPDLNDGLCQLRLMVARGFNATSEPPTEGDDAKELCGEGLTCNTSLDHGKQLIREAWSNPAVSTALVAAGGMAITASAIVVATVPNFVGGLGGQ